MNKIKTIIVDDEKQGVSVLQKTLALYCQDIDIIATCYDAFEAQKIILELKPDLVFLDVAMPKKSGIQLLLEFEKIDFMVVFVTAYDQFVLQALRLSAIDYLLKPLQEHELLEAVEKCRTNLVKKSGYDFVSTLDYNLTLAKTKEAKISLPSSNGFVIKSLQDLIYCEADNTYTKFFFKDATMIMVTKSLSYYDQLLSDCDFIRIHKSFLINLHHIISYSRTDGGTIKLTNQIILDVSKRRKEILIEAIKSKYLN